VVHGQILYPARTSQNNPKTGENTPGMPAEIVTGDDAQDVAAYVADAVAAGGEDSGRLASIGAAKAEGVAKAEGGEVEIPADPGGSIAYTFASAEAPAGPLTLTSPNESSVPHNIALDGNGVDEVGEVVQGGGVSEIQADVQPGEYTFYCSVAGHREGGMEGTLTVK
jgi:plastocyanin